MPLPPEGGSTRWSCPGLLALDLETRVADPASRIQLLGLIRLVEQEQTLLDDANYVAVLSESAMQIDCRSRRSVDLPGAPP